MPGAIANHRNYTWQTDVGLRKLPFSGLEYYARAPIKASGDQQKNTIFKTVWLPVNASNRTVNDRTQDLMHMKYSYLNDKRRLKQQQAAAASTRRNGVKSAPPNLSNGGSANKLKVPQAQKDTTPQRVSSTEEYLKELSKKRNGSNGFSTFDRSKSHSHRNNFSILGRVPICHDLTRKPLPKIQLEMSPTEFPENVKIAMWKTDKNTIAPFASLGKPTCGYFFTRNIGHQKRLIGINATNTVKWRSNVNVMHIKNEFKKSQSQQ